MIKSFKPFEEIKNNIIKKGEKVVLTDVSFSYPVHLTLGKVYTITRECNLDFSIWIENDIRLESGYMARSYTFKKLTEVRKEKIFRLNDNS